MMANLQILAEAASRRMLNCVLEGAGLAVVAWIFLRFPRRHNSSTRFAIWYSVLIAIALLPFFNSAAGALQGSHAEITVPSSWALYFLIGWATIALVSLIRVTTGLWQIRQLKRTAVPVDNGDIHTVVRQTEERFPSGRRIEVRVSDSVRVPTAIGFFRPMVLIPGWAMNELGGEELKAVVLHELAHLRRWDDWSNLVQKILGAVLFFHPAVWWIGSRLSLEREMACDDLVLDVTDSPRAYAQCLVAMAEKSFLRRGLALAQAAVGRMRQTSLRVAQILDTKRAGSTRVWKPSLALVAIGVLASVGALAHVPTLIGFREQGTEVAHTSASSLASLDQRGIKAPVIQASLRRDLMADWGRPSEAGAAAATSVRKNELRSVKTKIAPKPSRTMVVRASLQPAQEVKPPDVFYVVLSNEQYTASGASVWSISVYRLTVFHPNKQQIRNETPAKNI